MSEYSDRISDPIGSPSYLNWSSVRSFSCLVTFLAISSRLSQQKLPRSRHSTSERSFKSITYSIHVTLVILFQAIRQGVHIETTKIPTLKPSEELRDNRGKSLHLNAFAYDFFKHGSVKVIQKENR